MALTAQDLYNTYATGMSGVGDTDYAFWNKKIEDLGEANALAKFLDGSGSRAATIAADPEAIAARQQLQYAGNPGVTVGTPSQATAQGVAFEQTPYTAGRPAYGYDYANISRYTDPNTQQNVFLPNGLLPVWQQGTADPVMGSMVGTRSYAAQPTQPEVIRREYGEGDADWVRYQQGNNGQYGILADNALQGAEDPIYRLNQQAQSQGGYTPPAQPLTVDPNAMGFLQVLQQSLLNRQPVDAPLLQFGDLNWLPQTNQVIDYGMTRSKPRSGGLSSLLQALNPTSGVMLNALGIPTPIQLAQFAVSP